MGRTLRIELMPQGASATVGYFGWVDTKLVQDAMAQEDAGRLNEFTPEWLLKRIGPDEAAAGLVRGSKNGRRAFGAQVVALRLAIRGVVMPLIDRRMERDEKMATFLRDLDAKSGVESGGGEAPREA